MKLLADLNISPKVVTHLRAEGHEIVRVGDVLHARATDQEILDEAARIGAVA